MNSIMKKEWHPRIFALGVLVVAATGGLLAIQAGVDRPKRVTRTPPWSLPHLVGSATDGSAWSEARLGGNPAILLYVQQGCPYCSATMETLSQIDLEVPVWIIVSPDSDIKEMAWIPSNLRTRTLQDSAWFIGRALEVGAVPATWAVDADGIVRAATLGETSTTGWLELQEAVIALPSTPLSPETL